MALELELGALALAVLAQEQDVAQAAEEQDVAQADQAQWGEALPKQMYPR